MCWMCAFQGEEKGRQLHEFIVKNIGYMEIRCVAQQVSDLLLLESPDADGADPNSIEDHIQRHMLHPRVRIAVILRQMLDFACVLQGGMVIRDGDLLTVDKGNAELYLKVVSHVMSLYRAEPQSMLFAEEAAGPSAATTAPA